MLNNSAAGRQGGFLKSLLILSGFLFPAGPQAWFFNQRADFISRQQQFWASLRGVWILHTVKNQELYPKPGAGKDIV